MKKWVSETLPYQYCGLVLGLAWDLRYILSFRSPFSTFPLLGSINDFEKVTARGTVIENGKLSRETFVVAY